MQAGAQGGAHVENAPAIDPKLDAWVAEMGEEEFNPPKWVG
jgi:hypothetical protein